MSNRRGRGRSAGRGFPGGLLVLCSLGLGCTALLGIDEDYVHDPSLVIGAGGTGQGGSGATGTGGCPDVETPPGGDCPAACTGGCAGPSCLIACTDANACRDDTVTCPADFDCVVVCSAESSCFGLDLTCPERYECSVSCEGTEACRSLGMTCGAGPCEITCGTGDRVCQAATVACGVHRCSATCESGQPPTLTCGSSCACSPC